jgi:predicted lipoprotein with Yx(FWY)xxD motif
LPLSTEEIRFQESEMFKANAMAIVLGICLASSASAQTSGNAMHETTNPNPNSMGANAFPAEVKTTDQGETLVSTTGKTLYTYDKDSHDKSTCTGQCAKEWHPLRVQAGAAAQDTGDWSIVRRSDGTKQWAYKGNPLYTSSKDTKPGETNGNGGDWHVAHP